MAITRTINYTQNTPVSLGFNNILGSTATSVLIDFWNFGGDMKMGTFKFDETDGVTISYTSVTTDPTIFSSIRLSGTYTAMNTALNSAIFQPNFYSAETITQDLLSQDRTLPTDYRGEMQIQIAPGATHGLAIGDHCRIKKDNLPTTRFLVTKIDSVNSATRIWLTLRNDYAVNETWYSSSYKNVGLTSASSTCYLQTDASVNITPIIDISFNNPHGDFTIPITVYNSSVTAIDSGTISFVGSFFVAEPTFTVQPATAITNATTVDSSTYIYMGTQIAQVDNNYQSVQLLIKLYENDPAYTNSSAISPSSTDAFLQSLGDAINAKAKLNIPNYISDTSLGQFGIVQVGQTASQSPTSGVVRWHFYGTPAECNTALSKIDYFRPVSVIKDFNIETRIVNGRTRIYSSRGK